jgi:tripartite-type tricarboxylate transporter receptor subunit TctC
MLFGSLTGAKMTHVPYKGTPAVQADVMNGTLQVAFDNVTSWAPQVKAGRMRALAVTSMHRSPLLPDVPTLAEVGVKGFEATTFAGIAVPSGTPRDVIAKLNADIASVINTPDFKSRMNGGEVTGGSPEVFRDYIAAERQKWGAVAKEINLTVD